MGYLDVQYGEARVKKTSYPAKLVDYLRSRVSIPENTMADFGCGRGDFTEGWAKHMDSVVYVDREPVRNIARNGTYEHMDFQKPRRLDQSVGLVFSKSVIEHLPDATQYLKAIHDSLKPEGKLIIMCPDWRTYWLNFWDDYTHVKPYDLVSLKDAVEAAGFTVESAERVYQIPGTWNSKWTRTVAHVVRAVTPLRFAVWLAETYNWTWLKWRCQMTVLVIASKGR